MSLPLSYNVNVCPRLTCRLPHLKAPSVSLCPLLCYICTAHTPCFVGASALALGCDTRSSVLALESELAKDAGGRFIFRNKLRGTMRYTCISRYSLNSSSAVWPLASAASCCTATCKLSPSSGSVSGPPSTLVSSSGFRAGCGCACNPNDAALSRSARECMYCSGVL